MTYQAKSAKARLASRRQHNDGREVPHGTVKRYKGSRARKPCHCDECRRAWADYIAERKRQGKRVK